jgi:hypothetical protein
MIMKPEEVLYTDGHDVTVTYSAIHVKKKWYSLNGITKHGLSILSPVRISSILLLIVGLSLALLGLFDLASEMIGQSEVVWFGNIISVNHLLFWTGISFLALAGVFLMVMHERYAISITTAEGEKNVIVSPQKEYIMQILKALNKAYLARVAMKTGMVRKKGTYAVS